MRRPERIPVILENIDWELFLKDNYGIDYDPKWLNHFPKHLVEFKEYWQTNFDMRIGQALINFGLVPDDFKVWNIEGSEWMIKTGQLEPRDILFWGNNYDKDMNRLPETKFKLIKDLNTDHIQAILDGKYTSNPAYLDTFNDELRRRSGNINKKHNLKTK